MSSRPKPKEKISYRMPGLTGFSLVELLISMLVMSIISAAIVMVYVGSQRGFITGIALMDINRDLRQVTDHMRYDIKSALEIVPSLTIGATTYVTGDTELILRVPSVTLGGDSIADTFDFVVFHLNTANPRQLERVVDADAASARTDHLKVIANTINSITFRSGGVGLSAIAALDSVTTINVVIVGQRTVLGTRDLQSMQRTSFTIRNRGE